MRYALPSLVLSLALLTAPAPARAIECEDWERLEGGKEARVQQLIDARLQGNQGQKYTSANRVDIRRCAMGFVPEIVAQFDGACAQGMAASMNALDEIFDKYFLSCIR